MRLLKNRQRHSTERGGWVLAFALLAAFMASGLIAVMFLNASTSDRSAQSERGQTEARYLAEAGVEAGKQALLAALADYDPAPAGGTLQAGSSAVPYTITTTGPPSVVTGSGGIQTLVTGYEIRSDATSDTALFSAHRVLSSQATPLFQFAVFYDNDLEINPGPNMTLAGRIHTNGDLYLGSGNTLTLDTNYVRAGGELYRRRKDDPSKSNGTVRVRQWVDDPFDPGQPSAFVDLASKSQMAAAGVATTSGYDSDFTTGYDANGDGDFDDAGEYYPWAAGALMYWGPPTGYMGTGSTIQTATHGSSPLHVPDVGSIAMFEPDAGGDWELDAASGEYVPVAPGTGTHSRGYFHENAGLTIITHANGSWEATDAAGVDVSASLSGAVSVKTIYDARQGGDVQVTEVDVDKLNASGSFPANGLLYASSYGMGTGTDAKGVKLVNGEELLDSLTVASEGSVYVQGDFNSQSKKGASVIADAVNLLSNAWDDSKTAGTLPKATETTFNLAFVSGNQDTVGSTYNGGFENLPRFHEKWSGVKCNIRGSFVNLWNSTHATGAWKYGGDRYTAPNRTWSYDPDFNDVANLPPFTPMALEAVEVVSW